MLKLQELNWLYCLRHSPYVFWAVCVYAWYLEAVFKNSRTVAGSMISYKTSVGIAENISYGYEPSSILWRGVPIMEGHKYVHQRQYNWCQDKRHVIVIICKDKFTEETQINKYQTLLVKR